MFARRDTVALGVDIDVGGLSLKSISRVFFTTGRV